MANSKLTGKNIIEIIALIVAIVSCCATVIQTGPVITEWLSVTNQPENTPTGTETEASAFGQELGEPMFPTLTPSPTDSSSSEYATISDEIQFVVLRQSPGYVGKNDVIVEIPSGEVVQILGGPRDADGLTYWMVSWNGYEGWMAEKTAAGRTIIIFDPE